MKKRIFKLFLAACSLSCIGMMTACDDLFKKPTEEPEQEIMGETDRTIQIFSIPETATCGYGSYFIPKMYYAYDSYGIRQTPQIAVYDKNYNAVELDEKGGFTVEQAVGSEYHFLYRATVDNDVLTKKQTVKVLEDTASPILNILQENVVVLENEAINLQNYYSVEDDSQVESVMEYQAYFNGEEILYEGGTFYADAGDYVFRMRAADGSGNTSEWGEIKILARDACVVADFEVESDIYNGKNGIQAKGNYTVERSQEKVRSGNYSMKWQKTKGSNAPSLQIVHGYYGETNGANLGESYLYFGFWVYFEPKDNSGEINIKYTSTKYRDGYHWENALQNMWFFVDGDLVGNGRCNGSKTVKLPTEQWVYVVGEVVEYANTAFSLLAEGYADDTFTAYLDDMRTAHMAQVNETNVEYNYYYDEDAVFNLNTELNPYIREKSSAAFLGRPNYEVYKCDEQGNEVAVPVSEGRVVLSPGAFKVFYVGSDGEKAGHYTKLTVRKTLKNLVEYVTDGNDMNTLPYGVVGKDYKIPQAKVNVADTTVETAVLYNGNNVNIKDGKFIPTETGVYTLRYTFTKNGESEAFEYQVAVENTFLQGELTSNFADVEKQLSGIVGETIVLPVIRVTGGSGNISQSVEVSLNGEIVTLIDNTFVPDKPGTYKVTFYSKDYFKTLEESYTISIAHSDTPIFENLPKLPLALVSGYTYSMGTPNVYMYTVDGKVVKEAKGYWEYKGNRTQFDKELTPVVENSGDIIKLLYTVGDYEYVLGEYAVQIPMLNGQFNPSVFFLTEKGMNSSVDSATTILSSSVSDATATYINPLASEPWSFSFSIDPAKNKGTVKIILSDYSNPTSKVTLKITKNDATKSWLSVNGGNNVSIAGSFENESNRFSLVLNCLTGVLTDDNTGTLLAMLTKEVGTWGSEGIQMQIVFEDVVGEFALKGYMLNKQVLRLIDEDGSGPILLKNGEFALIQYIGEEILLPSCRAFDMFDYNVLPVVSLSKLGGVFVQTIDGVTLNNVDATKEYRLLINEEGTYLLTYLAVDNNGNEVSLSYMLKVQVFGTKATIEVEGELAQSVETGETFTLPVAKGYDKSGNEISVLTYIRYPSSRVAPLTDKTITFEEKGTYEIIFYVKDASGCAAYKTITVTVK